MNAGFDALHRRLDRLDLREEIDGLRLRVDDLDARVRHLEGELPRR